MTETLPSTASPTRTLDALIIGAGVAGLYQLHQLRNSPTPTVVDCSLAGV